MSLLDVSSTCEPQVTIYKLPLSCRESFLVNMNRLDRRTQFCDKNSQDLCLHKCFSNSDIDFPHLITFLCAIKYSHSPVSLYISQNYPNFVMILWFRATPTLSSCFILVPLGWDSCPKLKCRHHLSHVYIQPSKLLRLNCILSHCTGPSSWSGIYKKDF